LYLRVASSGSTSERKNHVTTLRTSRAGATLALAALLAGFPLALAGFAPAAAKPAKAHHALGAAGDKQAKATTAGKAAKPTAKAADPDDAEPEAIAEKRTPHYTSESGVDEGVPTQEGCVRPRKRLWVEGEGWIVRRVTVCR
jgi:hypothetical protein